MASHAPSHDSHAAPAGDDYHHGEMPVREQSRTWTTFMQGTWWLSSLSGLGLTYITLVFAVGLPWFPVLIGMFVLSLLVGAALKLGNVWTVTTVILGVVLLLSGIIAELAKAAIV